MTPLGIEALGTLPVSAMVLCYAAEDRGSVIVFGFALACLGSSVYAGLIGSWPFMLVEFLWSIIAFRRWRRVAGMAARASPA